MIGYISMEEQVDADFSRALRRAFVHKMKARLRGDPAPRTLSLDEATGGLDAYNRISLGKRIVPVEKIVGSVGRSQEFDAAFLPTRRSMEARWKRVDGAFHRGVDLQPVTLCRLGDAYFVEDGNHRVSVARYHGVEWMEAYVTDFHPLAIGQIGARTKPKRTISEYPAAA
jgi:hypothetical protein